MMSNFCREARVWLRLVNNRIMPIDHYSSMSKLAHPLDRVLDPIDSMVEISKVMAPGLSEKHNLTPTAERAGQSTLIAQMYKILVIHGENMRLDYSSVYVEAAHTVYSRALLGEDVNLLDNEDVCSVDLMQANLDVGEEVESQPQVNPNNE
ncbi:hypothetical protein RND71_019111 [Anisodus tanguticus]|uniref:Uncharacterized protein n=1 Tax=Anisodus tanguticus TaxID=243964 RepID=A0AAE1VG61_9SOLA|nr:hypothetical protein RND71_019111 [Anisodus tanguticus]